MMRQTAKITIVLELGWARSIVIKFAGTNEGMTAKRRYLNHLLRLSNQRKYNSFELQLFSSSDSPELVFVLNSPVNGTSSVEEFLSFAAASANVATDTKSVEMPGFAACHTALVNREQTPNAE